MKTMVEHDYGTAGYLVNHPDTNVAAAFTKDKTDSDLEVGRRILKEEGYHGNADPRLIPAVYAYRKHTAVWIGGMFFCVFLAVFLTVWIYIRKQNKAIAKADAEITRFLSGDTGQRIDSEETGDWYSLFHRINELASILSAQAEHEKQTREFLQDMISDVSHQLKTLLAALKMYDEIMAQEEYEAVPCFVREKEFIPDDLFLCHQHHAFPCFPGDGRLPGPGYACISPVGGGCISDSRCRAGNFCNRGNRSRGGCEVCFWQNGIWRLIHFFRYRERNGHAGFL